MKNSHEKRVFYLLATLLGFAILYVYMITFIPLPKENIRFADTSLGFFLGTLITSIVAYYIGSSPTAKAKGGGGGDGTTTAEFTASVTTEPVQEPEKE